MADPEHLAILNGGVENWNKWRREFPGLEPNLSNADLKGRNFCGINFCGTNLCDANLRGAILNNAKFESAVLINTDLCETILPHTQFNDANLRGAQLRNADLTYSQLSNAELDHAYFYNANLTHANLTRSDLIRTCFWKANLSHANLQQSNLIETDLREADLSYADLEGATLRLANLTKAKLIGCKVYGIACWKVCTDEAEQSKLIITPHGDTQITVDSIETAQFMYLIMDNKNLKCVIDEASTKIVLILGRFDRKKELGEIKKVMLKNGYIPIIFDFDAAENRTFLESVMTFAYLSRFVIADLTAPKCIPLEIGSIIPNIPSVPVVPIIERLKNSKKDEPFAMFESFLKNNNVLELWPYENIAHLIGSIKEKVIDPAEALFEQNKKHRDDKQEKLKEIFK